MWRRADRLAAALVLGALLAPRPATAGIAFGSPFPALPAAARFEGTPPQTAGKVVLVDFWASWCAPCKASFPVYARLQADYAKAGLVVVAISVDQDRPAFESFVKKLRPPFAVAWDADQSLVRAVAVPTMPTSYVVDRRGRVRFLHAGFHGAATEDALRKELETLLAEPAS